MSYTLYFIFDCKIGIERELEPLFDRYVTIGDVG